jgi:hypothetical protein
MKCECGEDLEKWRDIDYEGENMLCKCGNTYEISIEYVGKNYDSVINITRSFPLGEKVT